MFENPVKKKLAAGGVAWGAAPVVPHPLAIKLTVDSGVDFAWMDTEHTTHGMEAFEGTPVMARAKDVMPLIRVPWLDPGHVKKALDAGAQGIMIPQIDNAEQAALAVRYAKYPPEGNRGVSPMWTFYMGIDWKDYLPHANSEILVIVQVETAEAMGKVEEIAQVPGVDVVLAGPADLSAAMGRIGDTNHPDVQKFLAEFPARVTKYGKTAGIAIGGVEAAVSAYQRGYRLINFANLPWDGFNGIRTGLAEIRERTGT